MLEGSVRQRFEVIGRVQGVGFRAWVVDLAGALSLSGHVRNRADGAVEVEVEGPRGVVERLRRQLAAGPPYARVDLVRELAPGSAPLPAAFRIVR